MDKMNCSEKLVSVVVPVYNCEAYLERCLDSLMAQTLPDIEFILIDNGSTDQSGAILHRYLEKDNRFSLISQENQGIRGSRNSGLRAARGLYVGFVDADDFVEPAMFQTLWERASETRSDVAVCDYAMTFPKREEYGVLGLEDAAIDAEPLGKELFYLRYFGKNPVVWNKLYRRSLIDDNKIRFEVNHGEDLLFQLRLLPHIKRLCTVQGTLYHYVQRRSSAAHSLDCVSSRDTTMLTKYLDGGGEDPDCERLSELAFSNVFTGFLFSAYCIGRPLGYFYEQIQNFRCWKQFDHFCELVSRTGELRPLYQEGVISIRFYWFQKLLFGMCACGRDRIATLFLWACSKLIILKKRRFLFEWFE